MRKKLLELHRKLKTEYGSSGGWKPKAGGRKLDWPAESPYEVAIGAVLVQNTNWKNAEKAISNLKGEKLIDTKKILKINLKKLERLICPSGFYRQKAKRLKEMTKTYLKLLKMSNVKEMRKLLLETHGIGRETADSILLYAFDRPVFVIDAYTRRFCMEFFKKGWKNYEDCRNFFERNLPRDAKLYGEYHALIVEWAKRDNRANVKRRKPDNQVYKIKTANAEWKTWV